MKIATKLVYLAILIVVTAVPIIVWAQNPKEIDLSGVGAFVAGLGVPMGTLTAAMAARSISRDKKAGGVNRGPADGD